MILKICEQNYSLQWNGIYYFALTEYPHIKDWELDKIAKFIAYEKLNDRDTKIECDNTDILTKVNEYIANSDVNFPFTPLNRQEACIYNENGKCVTSDYLSHTCTLETAIKIFESGKLLSAVRAFERTDEQLVNDKRNAAGDPKDYFHYIMFNWSNTSSGYKLAMERLLERFPNEYDLNEGFVPSISFHFKYEDIIRNEKYVFDGYHAAKIRDELSLADNLYACIIPTTSKKGFEEIIPENIKSRIYYLDYTQEGIIKWTEKVYQFVSGLS
ncbi:hypothetical protein [Streptococcus massiliensis]|uniref:Phosphate ABC transporter ATPase n=1 Tax=Streptococcus massiliensis TaxID=313439 RepID=A0A380KYM0_9STRE|nr:hypothetical protein [Streptococcus massiliensis]SUN76026.1 phosphate ABC transporter ATPase [Streptococcus massiliensis]